MSVVDYFLKIAGIDGEAQDSKHKGELDVESYTVGATQSGTSATGGGIGGGKVHVQDFHFVTKVSKASPKLFEHCWTGQHIKEATLTCRKAGGEQEEYLKIKMTDVLISSFQSAGSGGSDILPMEQISFSYGKIEVEYKEQKPDGSLGGAIKAGWDVKANKKV